MRYKLIKLIFFVVCIIIATSACSDIDHYAVGETSSTEKYEITTEKQNSEIMFWPTYGSLDQAYPAVVDECEPDLEYSDYSKIVFIEEIVYMPPLNAEASDLERSITMRDYSMTKLNDGVSVSSFNQALSLIKTIIEKSENAEYSLIIALNLKHPGIGIYNIDSAYSTRYEMWQYTGENQILMFYADENLTFRTPEGLTAVLEKYTRFSSVTSIIVSAVPIPAEN